MKENETGSAWLHTSSLPLSSLPPPFLSLFFLRRPYSLSHFPETCLFQIFSLSLLYLLFSILISKKHLFIPFQSPFIFSRLLSYYTFHYALITRFQHSSTHMVKSMWTHTFKCYKQFHSIFWKPRPKYTYRLAI